MKKVLIVSGLIAAVALGALAAEKKDEVKLVRKPSPKGAKAYIVMPKDGKTVKPKFKVIFGLRKMGVAPANIDLPNTGHHHLLIDAKELPPMNLPLPASDTCRHFGGGQTEVMLELPPGKHTLQLVLGDFAHIPHDPPVVSEKITITVAEPK